MTGLGVPVLDWLHLLAASHDDCTWAEGLACDDARPNGRGHQKMFASVDQALFEPAKVRAVLARQERPRVGSRCVCQAAPMHQASAFPAFRRQPVQVAERGPTESMKATLGADSDERRCYLHGLGLWKLAKAICCTDFDENRCKMKRATRWS